MENEKNEMKKKPGMESQAYALTDELRQLQKDERLSTQQNVNM